MSSFSSWRSLLAGLLTTLAVGPLALCDPSAWYEGFEGPQPSWRPAGGNAQHRVDLHQRIQGEAHTGSGCEVLRVEGSGGSVVYFSHDVGQPQVIAELLPTVWVKADRPGIQLAAEIVLPRGRDPRSGGPLSVLVQGTTYTIVGRWQQLRIEDVPQALRRQVWSLRAQWGPNIDPAEAYVGRLLVNVYGGPGVTNLWIDDLDIAGYVPRPGIPAPSPAPGATSGGPAGAREGSPAGALPATGPANPSGPAGGQIKLTDSVLLVDEIPMLPRGIQYQGEPLSLLEQLGFNVVWLGQPPTAELLEEVNRLAREAGRRGEGLWLVCPPPGGPPAQTPLESPDAAAAMPEIGPLYDRVLAWDLGHGLGVQQAAAAGRWGRWARQVKMADRRQAGRPLVCQAETGLKEYSRAVEFLILSRSPLGTSLELADYAAWLRQRPRLAVPGKAVWTTIQTQPAEPLRQQWAALGRGPLPGCLSSEQIQLLAYTAVTAGSRGLLFESRGPLSAADVDTRVRALTLELINLELKLAEPWAAAGYVMAWVGGNEPGTFAAQLQREHSRLLVPLWLPPNAQYVTGLPAAKDKEITFIVPGVPETYSAYLMSPGRLERMRPKRVTGGLSITLDQFNLGSLVLLTNNDPNTLREATRVVERTGHRRAELLRALAEARLQQVNAVSSQSAGRIPPVHEAPAWLSAAEKNLRQSTAYLAANDDATAYGCAERAMRPLRLLEHVLWKKSTDLLDSPVSSPAAVLFSTLPDHWSLVTRIAASRPGENLLPGGDFEDSEQFFRGGWQCFWCPTEGVQSGSELAGSAARSGRFGLRVVAEPRTAKDAPAQLESPAVWIVSAPVHVAAGSLVRIQGWVKVSQPIQGSVDGLLIVDSLGGEPLAERLRQTTGWRPFTLYRGASQAGPVVLTFYLCGLGEAWLDDVTIQVLQPTATSPLPPPDGQAQRGPGPPLPGPRDTR